MEILGILWSDDVIEQTDAGRYLFVVFIYKRNRRALIVTAREMTEHEKGGYRRRKRYG